MSTSTQTAPETRVMLDHCELRVERADDGQATISGYAAVFGKLSEDLGGFREIIKRGAFRDSLEGGADIRALVDHDPSKIIGRTASGTLQVKEDRHGLRVSITPPDTQAGRDIVTSIGRGDVSGMSFGFRTVEDRWVTRDGGEVRELVRAEVFDVSAVTFPAYPDTEVALRALEKRRDSADSIASRRQTAALRQRLDLLEADC